MDSSSITGRSDASGRPQPPAEVESETMTVASREQQIAAVIGSMRLEGLEPSDQFKALAARYTSGEIDMDQLVAEAGLEPSPYLAATARV